VIEITGAPYRNRTGVFAVRGRRQIFMRS